MRARRGVLSRHSYCLYRITRFLRPREIRFYHHMPRTLPEVVFRRPHVWVNYLLQQEKEEGSVSLKNQGVLGRFSHDLLDSEVEPRTNRDGQSFTTKWTLRFFCQHE